MPQSKNPKGVRHDRRQVDWRRVLLVLLSILLIISWILALIVK
ncbi:MAG: hypothetical protein ABFD14_09645 [Anaerolineaceae bacterium]|jgi:hypothetical protein